MGEKNSFFDQNHLNELFAQLQRMMNGDFWGAITDLQRSRMNSFSSPFSFPFPGMDMDQLGKMLDQLRSMTGETVQGAPFTEEIRTNLKESFPVQLWESRDKFYLQAFLPGLKSEQDVQFTLKDPTTLLVKVKFPSLKPQQESRLVHSEFPHHEVNRSIRLPYPVSTKHYSSHYVKGIFTMILDKEGEREDEWIFDGEE
ncbi:hypothetical protein CULT_1300007 [[Clostridium] ultunense Esp]|uniref:Hsp20/alpha crystallin family protein n=1 Tax=Thermicanus aegyptius TaxID=94009 RepID=UPI0002B6FB57|nr:Hsp20/alpha crystallin family protein [Thermicanus aegyptius]CCQ93341.1 hypothetical protein CULT_1300007 [[Clostridium] ultunense Esp]